jgi:hypothetical protein
MAIDEEFREAAREALIEEVRMLRGLTPEERLALAIRFDRETRPRDERAARVMRLLEDRTRDDELDLLDRIGNGA